MGKLAFALLTFSLTGGVLVPAATAEQLRANVVSWSPNDVRPSEPVSVVLQVYTLGPSPYPDDGDPVAGVNDVEVVIRGDGRHIGSPPRTSAAGRYGTEIIFPKVAAGTSASRKRRHRRAWVQRRSGLASPRVCDGGGTRDR
jgi:hypothetical protein